MGVDARKSSARDVKLEVKDVAVVVGGCEANALGALDAEDSVLVGSEHLLLVRDAVVCCVRVVGEDVPVHKQSRIMIDV